MAPLLVAATLLNVNGGKLSPLASTDAKATVLYFIDHDCPICNSYVPEMNRIAKQFAPQKVRFFAIYSEVGTPVDVERKHDKAYGFAFPAASDPDLSFAHSLGATVTPEAIVWAGGKVVYRGRIDNTYASIGVRRLQATAHDLKDVLDELLSGRPVSHPVTQAIGCYIPATKT